jgi:acyl carrier protein
MMPAKALNAMEYLLQTDSKSELVAAIDWSVLGPAMEMRQRQRFIEDCLIDKAVDVSKTNATVFPLLNGFANVSKEQRVEQLLELVAIEVRKIFGMKAGDVLDESRGLFQMGMDSLMSVKLKRALERETGLNLPGTLTLLYPNILALAAFLEQKLAPSNAVSHKGGEALIGDTSRQNQAVSEMSDQETSAAIAMELVAIQQKLGTV